MEGKSVSDQSLQVEERSVSVVLSPRHGGGCERSVDAAACKSRTHRPEAKYIFHKAT